MSSIHIPTIDNGNFIGSLFLKPHPSAIIEQSSDQKAWKADERLHIKTDLLPVSVS